MEELEGIVSSAEMAAGGRAVLCIDQLDALSFVSGRNVQGREVLEELVVQATRYPELRILLACRAFDLDRDASLSALVSVESPAARRIGIERLTVEDVYAALAAAGITASVLTESQLDLLRTPLHLYLFVGGGTTRDGFGSRRDLFDRYWDDKRLRVDEFTEVGSFVGTVDRISNRLSARRQLQAPVRALSGHEAALDAMASEGVVVLEDGQAAFFHACSSTTRLHAGLRAERKTLSIGSSRIVRTCSGGARRGRSWSSCATTILRSIWKRRRACWPTSRCAST